MCTAKRCYVKGLDSLIVTVEMSNTGWHCTLQFACPADFFSNKSSLIIVPTNIAAARTLRCVSTRVQKFLVRSCHNLLARGPPIAYSVSPLSDDGVGGMHPSPAASAAFDLSPIGKYASGVASRDSVSSGIGLARGELELDQLVYPMFELPAAWPGDAAVMFLASTSTNFSSLPRGVK